MRRSGGEKSIKVTFEAKKGEELVVAYAEDEGTCVSELPEEHMPSGEE